VKPPRISKVFKKKSFKKSRKVSGTANTKYLKTMTERSPTDSTDLLLDPKSNIYSSETFPLKGTEEKMYFCDTEQESTFFCLVCFLKLRRAAKYFIYSLFLQTTWYIQYHILIFSVGGLKALLRVISI
jgi:hypothetical protein